MTWVRRGTTESVRISGDSADYADVNRFAYSVVTQIGPHIVPGSENVPLVPGSRVDLIREDKART